jgi:hypothetical protein
MVSQHRSLLRHVLIWHGMDPHKLFENAMKKHRLAITRQPLNVWKNRPDGFHENYCLRILSHDAICFVIDTHTGPKEDLYRSIAYILCDDGTMGYVIKKDLRVL